MNYRITGLPVDQFKLHFGVDAETLRERGIRRCIADRSPGFPDRISLRDAKVGESLLLLNYTHQPADTPFHASHAIFVLESAEAAYDRINEVPRVFRHRVLSLRAFDTDHMMVNARLTHGAEVEDAIQQLLLLPEVSYLQAHYAQRGCFAARIDRAGSVADWLSASG